MRAPHGSHARDLDLHEESCLDELLRHTAFKRGLEHSRFASRVDVSDDEHPLAVTNLDDAQQCKPVQCLADRGAPDTEFPGQLSL